ncbi:MAG TPA: ATP-binding protein [Streptosporangiaceae bacterium]|nr:ATP-binding protein [Streptosporangiaceae bacterium]
MSGLQAAYPSRVARLSAVPALQPGRELVSMRDWPLRSYLELSAVPKSVHPARSHARDLLREWCMDGLTDTVELLVSEIATNAVCASGRVGTALPLRFWLTSDRHNVLIQVWDADQHQPIPQHLGPDAECGRGLLLVETLSTQWGCYTPAGADGKIVWALCAQS